MKTVLISLACIVLLSSAVFANGVSSIDEEPASRTYSSNTSDRYLIKTVIREYVRKNGTKKLERVYNKLSDTTISLTPLQYRPVLTQIKEILEDEYDLGEPIYDYEVKVFEPLPAAKSKSEANEDTQMLKKDADKLLSPIKKGLEVEQGVVPKSSDILSIDTPIDKNIAYTKIYTLNEGSIDVGVLQQTRLGRVNAIRKERGRATIRLSKPLHITAAERSQVLSAKGVADHRRTASSSYYNYQELVDWFAQRDITFKNVNRATFTENIGYARLTCTVGDCTKSAITAMRTVFEFFISEEGTANDAHRRTIMHPRFKIMGMGIAVDESTKRLYVTQHYGTTIE